MRRKAWLFLAVVLAAEAAPAEVFLVQPGGPNDLEKVAQQSGVASEDVLRLLDRGWGFGQVGHALALAKLTGRPLSEIVRWREFGLGWEAIARNHGQNPGAVKEHARKTSRQMEPAPALTPVPVLSTPSAPAAKPAPAPVRQAPSKPKKRETWK